MIATLICLWVKALTIRNICIMGELGLQVPDLHILIEMIQL